MKTKATKENQIKRKWHLVDVDDKILGRIAPVIASLLRGKSKPYFVPNLDCGDFVVVINAKLVKTTGKKEKQKVYTRYSGYPSGLKKETLETLRQRKPEDIINHAVRGMLPANKLRDRMMTRLFVSANEHHRFAANLKKETIK